MIIVTGDLLRPSKGLLFNDQTGNILWLYHLLRYPLMAATGLPVKALVNEGLDDYLAQYTASGLEPTLDGWASLYTAAPAALKTLWLERLRGVTLVVGFEIPPSLRQTLEEAGIRYVDAMLDPVRFMDDIFLCFRSNDVRIQCAIWRHSLAVGKVHMAAGAIRAFAARRASPEIGEASILYAAQTAVDRSMIVNGKFLTASAIIEGVAPLVSGGRVLYKDHPYDRTSPVRDAVRVASSSFRSTDANIYLLLASKQIDTVVSVSSSAGHEASFFEKKASFSQGLSTPVRYRGNEDIGCYTSVYNAFLGPDFWREVLGDVIRTSRLDGDGVPYRQNYLRASLGSYWGYNIIANDPIVDNAATIDDLRRIPQTRRLLVACEKVLNSRLVKLIYHSTKALSFSRKPDAQ